MEQELILQLYSQDLAQAIYEKNILKSKNQILKQELLELKQVLESDETLKALFDEQKEKLGGR